jgi:hypothetical protein
MYDIVSYNSKAVCPDLFADTNLIFAKNCGLSGNAIFERM